MASRAVRTTSAALPVTVVGIVAGGKDAVGRLRTLPLPPPPPPPPPIPPNADDRPAATLTPLRAPPGCPNPRGPRPSTPQRASPPRPNRETGGHATPPPTLH